VEKRSKNEVWNEVWFCRLCWDLILLIKLFCFAQKVKQTPEFK
jgi:hypothetical protein